MLQQGRVDRNLDPRPSLELVEAQRGFGEVDVFPLNPAAVAQKPISGRSELSQEFDSSRWHQPVFIEGLEET